MRAITIIPITLPLYDVYSTGGYGFEYAVKDGALYIVG